MVWYWGGWGWGGDWGHSNRKYGFNVISIRRLCLADTGTGASELVEDDKTFFRRDRIIFCCAISRNWRPLLDYFLFRFVIKVVVKCYVIAEWTSFTTSALRRVQAILNAISAPVFSCQIITIIMTQTNKEAFVFFNRNRKQNRQLSTKVLFGTTVKKICNTLLKTQTSKIMSRERECVCVWEREK